MADLEKNTLYVAPTDEPKKIEISESTTDLFMAPVCSCGHIFTNLSYDPETGVFLPCVCPGCNKFVSSVSVRDIDISLGLDGVYEFIRVGDLKLDGGK